ncbi:uncharacterized protein LOC144470492 [Augochlora pura]
MRKISKNKVNQAIEFLRINKKSKEKWQPELNEEEKLRKINSHCKVLHQYNTREKQHVIALI